MSLFQLSICRSNHFNLDVAVAVAFWPRVMYIDAQPVSLHARQAAAAAMAAANIQSPTPQMRRPPAILNNSSSSSLPGMELTAPRTPPSFRAFVKRTPPVDHDKPLPPMPQHVWSPSPKLEPKKNRTSSIYSRTMSQWIGTPVSWRSRDFAATDMFLQPSIYSLSTPELVVEDEPRRSAVHTLLLPRAYEPLFQSPAASPSPSYAGSSVTPLTEVSSISLEDAVVDRRPSDLLPLSQPTPKLSPNHIRTVSLDKTRQAEKPTITLATEYIDQSSNSKRTLHKSRSMAGFGDMIMEEMRTPTSPTLRETLYNEWQDEGDLDEPMPNIIQPSPWIEPSIIKFKLRESKLSDKFFGVDPIDRAAMAPVVRQQMPLRKSSILEDTYLDYSQAEDLSRKSLSSSEGSNGTREHFIEKDYDDLSSSQMSDDSRRESIEEDYHGILSSQLSSDRAREQIIAEGSNDRGTARNSSTATNVQNTTVHPATDIHNITSLTNASLISQADLLAQEYHELLPRRTIFPTQPHIKSRKSSMGGQDIKMAPKPLFFNPRQVSKQRTEQYYRERNQSLLSASIAAAHDKPGVKGRSRWRNPSPTPTLPLKLSLTPDSTRASSSTSGSIPISPPTKHFKPRSGSSARVHDSVAGGGKKPSIFANILSAASASAKSPPLQQHTRSSISNISPDFFNPHAVMYAASEHVKSPKFKKEHGVKSEAPIPALGATVVATRAEAEKAFQTPIVLPGPNLSALSFKRPSTAKAPKRQPTLTSELMASYASPFGQSNTSLTLTTTSKVKPTTTMKTGHKHKSSDSSTGSSNLTIRMFSSGVSEKVGSIFHRRDGSTNRAIATTAAVTHSDIPGSTTKQEDRAAVSTSPTPLHPSTAKPQTLVISAPIPITTNADTSRASTSIFSSTTPIVASAPSLFLPLPPALPRSPKSPNWPLKPHSLTPTPPSPRSVVETTDNKGTHRRPRLLAQLTEMSNAGRESRADRRREELKRSIRVVHGGVEGAAMGGERGGGGGGAHNWL